MKFKPLYEDSTFTISYSERESTIRVNVKSLLHYNAKSSVPFTWRTIIGIISYDLAKNIPASVVIDTFNSQVASKMVRSRGNKAYLAMEDGRYFWKENENNKEQAPPLLIN